MDHIGPQRYAASLPHRLSRRAAARAASGGLAAPLAPRWEVVVLELTHPTYDAARGRLAYDARLLTDDTHRGMSVSKPPLGSGALPASFGAASLFIDQGEQTFPIDDPNGKVIVWRQRDGAIYGS